MLKISEKLTEHRSRGGIINVVIFAICALFLCLRFWHIDADFPLNVTWSAAPFTDEGYYASAAIRFLRTKSWYLAGDFNPIVNMPVGQLIHALVFATIGPSLWAARISGLVAAALSIPCVYLIVRTYEDHRTALISSLLLASNYVAFAYSRLAVMESLALFFALSAILVCAFGIHRRKISFVVLGSILAALAVLTKGSMLFVFPVLLAVAFTDASKSFKQRVVYMLIACGVGASIVFAYVFAVSHYYGPDYSYFVDINFQARRVSSLVELVRNIISQAYGVRQIGIVFVGISALSIALAIGLSGFTGRSSILSKPIVRICIVYVITYFVSLVPVAYGPSRYFVPLIPAIAILCAVSLKGLEEFIRGRLGPTILSHAPFVLVSIVMASGAYQIGIYLTNLQYSYLTMLKQAASLMSDGRTNGAVPKIFGNLSNTLALEATSIPINAELGLDNVRSRFEQHSPEFLVTAWDEDDLLSTVSQANCEAILVGEWRVLENYYPDHKNVKLWMIRHR